MVKGGVGAGQAPWPAVGPAGQGPEPGQRGGDREGWNAPSQSPWRAGGGYFGSSWLTGRTMRRTHWVSARGCSMSVRAVRVTQQPLCACSTGAPALVGEAEWSPGTQVGTGAGEGGRGARNCLGRPRACAVGPGRWKRRQGQEHSPPQFGLERGPGAQPLASLTEAPAGQAAGLRAGALCAGPLL